MEGPVKERLTGALILVAALVIIVPEMILGPGPRSASSALTPAQQADAGAPLRTYSVVLNGSANPGAVGQATLVAQPAAEPVVETPAPVTPVAATTAAASTQVATVEPASTVTASTPPSPGNWWAQLGSFSSHENADRLVRQLRAAGYEVDMSKVSAAGKELYRVRAGPVRSRMEAQALQSRLAAAGHKSSIVAP